MMQRSFAAIRTEAECKDALEGARVVSFSFDAMVLETIGGERFVMHFVAKPVRLSWGGAQGQSFNVSPGVLFQFHGEDEPHQGAGE